MTKAIFALRIKREVFVILRKNSQSIIFGTTHNKGVTKTNTFKEEKRMTNNSSSNRVEVPEAKGALDRFKFEVANEIGVDLKEGYNGHLTTAQAGSVGGEMVRKMIRRQEEQMSRQDQGQMGR